MAAVCAGWLRVLGHSSGANAWVRLISTCLLGAAAYIGSMLLVRPKVLEYVEEIMASSDHKLAVRALFLWQRLPLLRKSV
jgi:hypothetical protein